MHDTEDASEDYLKSQNLTGGRYQLVEQLGIGGFGEVFKAKDIEFTPPRWVAIKFLHPRFLAEAGVREDVKREAGVLAQFNHPNILRVIDFKVSKDTAYIVTDLAEGGSLAGKLRPDPTKPPGGLPLEEVAHLLEQMADAIDEAHTGGLVHRDLKPLNILLDKRGRPLIADFGLATALSTSQSSMLVDTGKSGTPPYMAPEQWLGQSGKASDIYALAAMTYQLVTGYTPFQGTQMELMGQHLNLAVPPLSQRAPNLVYPKVLDKVFTDALAKDPARRTKPAMEFYRRFRAALQDPAAPKVEEPLPRPKSVCETPGPMVNLPPHWQPPNNNQAQRPAGPPPQYQQPYAQPPQPQYQQPYVQTPSQNQFMRGPEVNRATPRKKSGLSLPWKLLLISIVGIMVMYGIFLLLGPPVKGLTELGAWIFLTIGAISIIIGFVSLISRGNKSN